METLQQIDDFATFAKGRLDSGLERTIDDLYDEWRQHAFRDTDARAVQAAIRDLENGQRGKPLDEFLTEFDAERDASKK